MQQINGSSDRNDLFEQCILQQVRLAMPLNELNQCNAQGYTLVMKHKSCGFGMNRGPMKLE